MYACVYLAIVVCDRDKVSVSDPGPMRCSSRLCLGLLVVIFTARYRASIRLWRVRLALLLLVNQRPGTPTYCACSLLPTKYVFVCFLSRAQLQDQEASPTLLHQKLSSTHTVRHNQSPQNILSSPSRQILLKMPSSVPARHYAWLHHRQIVAWPPRVIGPSLNGPPLPLG